MSNLSWGGGAPTAGGGGGLSHPGRSMLARDKGKEAVSNITAGADVTQTRGSPFVHAGIRILC